MRIFLKSLKLENFKGIKDLSVDFNNDITNIYADNGLGKTTIFDAYTWLLWDKDSLNRKDFSIKPYDKNGEEIHNLESSVEGVLLFDDTELTLKKIYKEIWTKKRGSTQSEFTGHTTDYYINSVPIKKKEYNDRLATVIDEDNFNLLSNPLYFNQIIDKNKRRSIVLSLIDDVGQYEVIKANEDLKELDLDNYTVDELKKMAKDSAKKINKDIESIPARIDELEKSKILDIDFDALEFRKRSITPAIADIDKKLADASSVADDLTKITSEISKLEQEKLELKSNYEKTNKDIELKNQEIFNNQSLCEQEKTNNKSRIEVLKESLSKARERWQKTYAKKYDGNFKCPACGQDLLPEQVKEVIENFNKNKSLELQNIEDEAKNFKEEIDKRTETLTDLNKKTFQIHPNMIEPKRLKKIDSEIDTLKVKLKDFNKVNRDDLLEKKTNLQADLDDINTKLALRGQNEKLDERIKLLEEQEKELAKSYEKQQKIIYLCEEYTKSYVDLVSDKINDLFTDIKFKLFEQQINGGITETCEVTLNGVLYSDLNSAGKINAGLDVIKTISSKLDLKVPIFIDNAESINKLTKTDAQLVRLVVSTDEVIRID